MAFVKVTFRQIAIMLTKALPVEGEDFRVHVDNNLEAIKKLSPEAKTALKSAYIFSRKVPRDERNDFFQDLALTLLKASTKDDKLAYAIAMCDWFDWWKKYKIRQHFSLDSVIDDGDGNTATLGDLLIGEVDFERRIDGEVEAKTIWKKLDAYPAIKKIVTLRLLGQTITKLQKDTLERWTNKIGIAYLLN